MSTSERDDEERAFASYLGQVEAWTEEADIRELARAVRRPDFLERSRTCWWTRHVLLRAWSVVEAHAKSGDTTDTTPDETTSLEACPITEETSYDPRHAEHARYLEAAYVAIRHGFDSKEYRAIHGGLTSAEGCECTGTTAFRMVRSNSRRRG